MNIIDKIKQIPTKDGAGVNIKRIADFHLLKLDPFLMIDELKSDKQEDFMAGFPEHPHRGIETFTYIKEGGFIHKDHMGNEENIESNETQWMKAGSGVLHSEMPLSNNIKEMHGFQIWVNMPAKEKMSQPEYRDSHNIKLPTIHSNKYKLTNLNGKWSINNETTEFNHYDMSGNAQIADLNMEENAEIIFHVDDNFFGIMIYEGEISNWAKEGDFLVIDTSKEIKIKTGNTPIKALLFKGNPIREKIVHHGPFVMNTVDEIYQTLDDYKNGFFHQKRLD